MLHTDAILVNLYICTHGIYTKRNTNKASDNKPYNTGNTNDATNYINSYKQELGFKPDGD